MNASANITIHNVEQMNLNLLKHIKYSYVTKNIQRTNLCPKRAF